eukprot:CAMPEP_0172332178 /NCGR_PEP_ID=MMETSP1058-20130122/62305_1 /TAXON_ID=83371 /ORGANISM="Detonula confervacea, Strain CCMP 353" /LENGTH=47 /DNA_ID= /DNA_START= /DNA_END= /DNA_ORIENTATION=
MPMREQRQQESIFKIQYHDLKADNGELDEGICRQMHMQMSVHSPAIL